METAGGNSASHRLKMQYIQSVRFRLQGFRVEGLALDILILP